MSVSDKQWLSRVRGLLQKHCGHFIRGRIELINAKVVVNQSIYQSLLVIDPCMVIPKSQVPILKFFDRTGGLEVIIRY